MHVQPQRILFTALVVLAALLLSGCERRTHTVRYEVGGTAGSIALSYQNASGATEQRDVRAPWRLEFRAQTWTHVGLSAFNSSPGGTVSCRVYVDNVLIQQATSEGGYKLAHCGGLAGITAATPTPER